MGEGRGPWWGRCPRGGQGCSGGGHPLCPCSATSKVRSQTPPWLCVPWLGWMMTEVLNAKQELIPGALIPAETPAATATFTIRLHKARFSLLRVLAGARQQQRRGMRALAGSWWRSAALGHRQLGAKYFGTAREEPETPRWSWLCRDKATSLVFSTMGI